MLRRTSNIRRFGLSHLILAFAIGAFITTIGLLASFRTRLLGYQRFRHLPHAVQSWSKPDFPIVAVVFYGRKRNVEILDCYLKQNLITNGGYLDSVHFVAHTKDEADLEYLDKLLQTEPLYSKVSGYDQVDSTPVDSASGGGNSIKDTLVNRTAVHTISARQWDWSKSWEDMVDPETMYIKIDDDVLWIGKDTIPQLVHSLLKRPDAYAMASNTINEADTLFQHYHNGAILPFLPEPVNATTRQTGDSATTSWRPSELPPYPLSTHPVEDEYNITAPLPSGYENTTHRWLPLPATFANLHKTPVDRLDRNGWREWTFAAQQHYSLLTHLEHTLPTSRHHDPHALEVYHFGDKDALYNMQLNRFSINFIAIWGRDVAAVKIEANDEPQMTIDISRMLGRPFLVDTRALVAHFAFGGQGQGMEGTDVRERYRGLANEWVCGRDNQIVVDVP